MGTLPTFMAFVSSAIGVTCLAFTAFEFNDRYFFRPLITMVLITYFLGCFSLPVFLTLLDGVDVLHFGSTVTTEEEEKVTPKTKEEEEKGTSEVKEEATFKTKEEEEASA